MVSVGLRSWLLLGPLGVVGKSLVDQVAGDLHNMGALVMHLQMSHIFTVFIQRQFNTQDQTCLIEAKTLYSS